MPQGRTITSIPVRQCSTLSREGHMASTFFHAFNGSTTELYKLGADQSVTQWTAIALNPIDLTEFDGNVWFRGTSATQGNQLYKLGFDGSVTQWTALNAPPSGIGLDPFDLTDFNDALWFNGQTPNQSFQLFKLGFDGSVTQWTATNPTEGGLDPINLTDFNNAMWFTGLTATQIGEQLF